MRNSADKRLSSAMKANLNNIKADEALINATLELIRSTESDNPPTRLSAIDSEFVSTSEKNSRKPLLLGIVATSLIAVVACVIGGSILILNFGGKNNGAQDAYVEPTINPDRIVYRPYSAPERNRTNAPSAASYRYGLDTENNHYQPKTPDNNMHVELYSEGESDMAAADVADTADEESGEMIMVDGSAEALEPADSPVETETGLNK